MNEPVYNVRINADIYAAAKKLALLEDRSTSKVINLTLREAFRLTQKADPSGSYVAGVAPVTGRNAEMSDSYYL